MKSGRVSKTALKIASIVIAVSVDEHWAERLPEGIGSLTERLLVEADVPMYRGGMVRFFKGPVTRWIVRNSRKTRDAYGGVAERKLFMNGQVLAAVEAGTTQVLAVGAGFDTLCLRLAPRFSEVRWFEIDHPATSAAKARGVEAIGKPDNMWQLAVDLGQTRLSEALAENPQWDPGARTIVVAEGLLMYLTHEQVHELLSEVRASTNRGSRLAFSHLLELEGQGAMRRFAMRMIGEPWLSSYTRQELPQALRELGWRVLEQDQPRSIRENFGESIGRVAAPEEELNPQPNTVDRLDDVTIFDVEFICEFYWRGPAQEPVPRTRPIGQEQFPMLRQ